MSRLSPGDRLVIATHNPGKLREIAELIAPFGVEAVSAGELGLPEPEETGADFVENAVLKARAAAEAAGQPALADDSGLEVAALDGAPGIYSARWAGPARDFRIAMERVESELAGKSEARFALDGAGFDEEHVASGSGYGETGSNAGDGSSIVHLVVMNGGPAE